MDKKALNTMLPPTVFKITTTGKGQMGASPIDSHVNKLDCTSKVNLITIWKPKCHFILFQSNSHFEHNVELGKANSDFRD